LPGVLGEKGDRGAVGDPGVKGEPGVGKGREGLFLC